MKTRAIVLALACCGLPAAVQSEPLLPMPSSGSLDWGHWHFSWFVGDSNEEGLVVHDVKWKGTSVLAKGSLPVIRVKYRGDGDDLGEGCGPYLDRIDWGNIEFLSGQLTPVTARIFGDRFELAVFAEIGGYDLYQAWYFNKSGRMEAVLYSSGWSCCDDGHENDHKHHPYWRLDFDVEGVNNEAWRIRTKNNGSTQTFKYPQEWNSWKESDDADIAWTMNKPGSNKHVTIRQPSNERKDTTSAPWFGFSSKDVGIRRYHSSENEEWPFDWDEHLGYKSPAESVDNKDIVFWTMGHLTHTWSQSDENHPHWHSRGMTVDVSW